MSYGNVVSIRTEMLFQINVSIFNQYDAARETVPGVVWSRRVKQEVLEGLLLLPIAM
jgi:hypothetical protein